MITLPLYPAPPPKGASRLERLFFLRKNYIYGIALAVPLLLVGLVFSSTVVLVCGGCWLIQMFGRSMLSLQIRAERRRTGH